MANLTTIAQGSERPILTLTWTHADNSTGEDLTDAVLTGYIKNMATGDVVEIQGTLAVTDAANGVFTWTPDPVDVAEDGTYQVQFSATWPGEPSPGLTAVFDWEISESIIPTDAPTALPDYQGVVKLLARTTDPDNPPAGYYGLYVKSGTFYLVDEDGNATTFDDGSTAAAAAIAAHVAEPDPHTQYLTEASAASTYSATAHTHDYAASGHNHDSAYISIIATPTAGNIPTITSGGELANSAYSPSSFAASGHNHSAAALDDLSDVDAAAPSDGDVLTWSDGDSAWIAAAPTSAGDMLKADYDTNADNTVDAADYATTAGDADTVDGSHASAFAASGHNHDSAYSAAGHTHDYAASGHNHDASYISVIGTPTEGNLPTITAGGELANSAYSPSSFADSGHNHDSAYISVIGSPVDGDLPTMTAGGELQASGYAPADFADAAHNHDSAYSATGHTHDYSGTYAAAAHAHDSDYISIIGTPTEGNIPTITAGGELANSAYAPSSFSASGHNHDASYAAAAHTHAYIAESIVDAKGDLLTASAADTPARLAVGVSNGMVLTVASGEATGLKWAAPVRYLTLGRGGTLTATAGTARLYVPFACTITNVRASVGTAPTGASLIVDVNLDGVTIFTNQGGRPTITATNFTDLTNVPDVTSISANSYLTVDCDQVGSTIAGADLCVVVEVTA